MKIDKIKSDNTKIFNSLHIKFQLSFQTKNLNAMINILMISSNGHFSNPPENIHMDHNSPNICLPWSFRVALSFKFKNDGVPLVLPYPNIYQQTISVHYTNLSQMIIINNLRFYSKYTHIPILLHQKKTIQNYQQHSEFILTKMTLSLPLNHQNRMSNSLPTWILTTD